MRPLAQQGLRVGQPHRDGEFERRRVRRPPVEPGFRLERQEKADRQIRYTLHAYATDAPPGLRYRPAGTPTGNGAA